MQAFTLKPAAGTLAPGHIRAAGPHDLAALLALEQACFASDRLSRRSFRHLLGAAHAVTLVDHGDAGLRGYLTLLFRSRATRARVYSIATAPACLGRGVASGLLRAAEALALARGCAAMRLEIRKDNAASQRLFQRRGYALFGAHAAYYEDGMDALRFEKALAPQAAHTALDPSPPSA